MAWIKLLENWTYRKPSFSIAYKAGHTYNVVSEAATLAIAAGKAIRLRKPHKDEEPQPWPSEAGQEASISE